MSGTVGNNLTKNLSEIYARLFNHRAFLDGELTFFLKEFEDKREDREVQQLFEILETVTEVKETQIEKACRLGEANLSNVTTDLEVALRMCNKTIERGSKENTGEVLRLRREARSREWDHFVEDLALKNTKVDRMFQEKEDELKRYYQDLQTKLHISPTHSHS